MAEKRFATPAPTIATPYTEPTNPPSRRGQGKTGTRRVNEGVEDEPNPTRGVTSHHGYLVHAGFPSIYLPLPSSCLPLFSLALFLPISRLSPSPFSHLNPSHPPFLLSRAPTDLSFPRFPLSLGNIVPLLSPRHPYVIHRRHHRRCHHPSITNTTQWGSSPSIPTKPPTSTVSGGDR